MIVRRENSDGVAMAPACRSVGLEASAPVAKHLRLEEAGEEVVAQVGDEDNLLLGREAMKPGRKPAEQCVETEADGPLFNHAARPVCRDRLHGDRRPVTDQGRVAVTLEDVERVARWVSDQRVEHAAKQDPNAARPRANLPQVEADLHRCPGLRTRHAAARAPVTGFAVPRRPAVPSGRWPPC